MIRTGVFTAVAERRARAALGGGMLLILLAASGASAAQVLNPSFEATYLVTGRGLLPRDWTYSRDTTCFSSYCSSSPGLPSWWKTDGLMSVGLFSLKDKPVTAGRYHYLYQEGVDLTGIGAIKFDVRLSVLPATYTGPFEHFEASFLVDGVPLWTQTVGGVYLDQEVNVAGLGAWRVVNGWVFYGHKIEMRITALDPGTFRANYWTQWDNLRLVEGQPTIPAVVALDPGTLNPASNGKWITCYIELLQEESGPTYDVRTIDGASVTLRGSNTEIHACTTGDEGWATAAANADNVADFDGDGFLERMAKFDRAAVQALVQPPQATTVSIQGKLASGKLTNGALTSGIPTTGLWLEGKATIRVLDNHAKK
ncbi:MAG: hypothetical protein M1376_08950 [Planctomycetes bacterium]|nr:hypothetical protein [Planctomycetota bacterium]